MHIQAEANLSALIESTEDLIWSVDLEGRLVAFNSALREHWENAFGVRAAVGMLTSEVVPPPRGRRLPALYKRVQTEGALRVEFPLSDMRILELALSPIFVDGEITGVSVFGKDITERKRAEEAQRESLECLREAQRIGALGSYLHDISTGLWSSSDVMDEIFGIDKNYERTFEGWTALIHPGDRDLMVAYFADEVAGNKNAFDKEYRIVRPSDGAVRWVHGMGRLEFDALGNILRMRGTIQDITEHKMSEMQLRDSEERYRTVFQTSLDCITISHLIDGRYVDVNKAFLDLIGVERHEIIGRTSSDLGIWANPETRADIVEKLRRDSSIRDFETQFVKKTGEVASVLISSSVIEIGGVSCIVSVVRDISGAKAAENEIRNLAFYDTLTGLANRRQLLDRLRQTLADTARSSRFQALLLVDLDNFKTLNDTLGHHMGDLLLKEVARRIVACHHEAAAVYRLGSDEFVVMLEDLSEVAEEAAAQAKAAAERILTAVDQPYLLEDRECLSSASIGITVYGNRQNGTEDILQQADIALHQAKAAGRKALRFFSPALQAAVNARATLEGELRHAIAARQFLLYYQPQLDSGRITGAEALIRWNHPRRGIVQPGEFIPLTEESRLILPLGEWILETACKQIVSWAAHEETAHLTLAVNISALQFRQPKFVEQVLAALNHTGASPRNLKLELTESLFVESFEDVIAKMVELHSHGLSFSLDDFGTGYSSLAYLKRLPLDQLKIDRAFVRDMLVDATSGAIAQTIISLARAMGLSVIAEGVETEEQRSYLASLGCHSFQGFLASRPLPLKEFTELL